MTTGTQGDQLLEDELTQMKANVRFMRAFYHYLLFEQYGPIILVKDKIYNATEDQDVPRNTVDEVIEYIDSELTAVASELTQEPILKIRTIVPGRLKELLWLFGQNCGCMLQVLF